MRKWGILEKAVSENANITFWLLFFHGELKEIT